MGPATLAFMDRLAPPDGAIGRARFAVYMIIALALYFGADHLMRAIAAMLPSPGNNLSALLQPSPFSLAGSMQAIRELIGVAIMVFAMSAALRRLWHIGLRGWWSAFFPLGFGAILSTGALYMIGGAAMFRGMLTSGVLLLSPFTAVQTLHAFGCVVVGLVLLVWPGREHAAQASA